jgi:hypothetical protein
MNLVLPMIMTTDGQCRALQVLPLVITLSQLAELVWVAVASAQAELTTTQPLDAPAVFCRSPQSSLLCWYG